MLFETSTLPKPRPAAAPPPAATQVVSLVAVQPATAPRLAATPAFPWAKLLGGTLLLLWAFWSTLDVLVEKWIGDPQYSHGFLVPLFSLYLLRQSWLNGAKWLSTPVPILAMVLLIGVLGLRMFAGGILLVQLDAVAFLLSLVALTMAIGGFQLTRTALPAMAFLIFMIHLPHELERNVGGPLKIVATEASTFLLQTLGYPAVSEGNLIRIDEVTLGVIDACSGLKMLMTFSAFAFGAVLILDRTPFEKLCVILGILPIAVFTNVLRITGTGVVYTLTNNKQTQNLAHDVNGWLMMPVGLALLALQLWVLGRLVVRPKPKMIGV
jgi:exosortase